MRIGVVGIGIAVVAAAAVGIWAVNGSSAADRAVADLIQCDPADVSSRVAAVVALGPAGRSAVHAVLTDEDATACERAALALVSADFTELAKVWLKFSPTGRAAVVARCLAEPAESARPIAERGLCDPSAEVRERAVALAARLGEAPPALLPLLSDPSPAVRRAVVLAVGRDASVIGDDDLLRWLHDADSGVRAACELALRARGLRAEEVRFAYLLTDPNPRQRLDLILQILADDEIDVAVWLRRLSHDPSPAVRAAVVRAAAERRLTSLADRLAQMASGDPDPAVRQNANYFVESANRVRPVSGR